MKRTVKTKTKTKKPQPMQVNRGLAPTAEHLAEMRAKGWDLAQNLAKQFGVGQSTIKFWTRRGRIDEKTQTLKAYGNRWYSISAVEAISRPPIPEAR